MNHKRWTQEEIERAKALLESGLTHWEIGEKLNRSKESVENMFKRRKIKAPKEFYRVKRSRAATIIFSDEQIESIRNDYEENILRIVDICKKYHIGRETLYRLVDEYEFKERVRKACPDRTIIPFKVLFDLYHEKLLTIEEIARRENVHKRVVQRSLDQHGMKRITIKERTKMRAKYSDSGKVLNRVADWSEKL